MGLHRMYFTEIRGLGIATLQGIGSSGSGLQTGSALEQTGGTKFRLQGHRREQKMGKKSAPLTHWESLILVFACVLVLVLVLSYVDKVLGNIDNTPSGRSCKDVPCIAVRRSVSILKQSEQTIHGSTSNDCAGCEPSKRGDEPS